MRYSTNRLERNPFDSEWKHGTFAYISHNTIER